MTRKKGMHNRIWAIVITAVLTVSLLLPLAEYNNACRKALAEGESGSETKPGFAAYVNYTDGLNVRVGPSAGSTQMKDKNGNLIQLTPSTLVRVIDDDDEATYRKIMFDYQGETLTGYVIAKYLIEYDETYRDEAFEKELDEQGFPESYREVLRAVHQWNPQWKFIAQHINLDWNEVLKKELAEGATVNQKHPSSWKSTDPSRYKYAVDDGEGGLKDGGWVIHDVKYHYTSEAMLAYSMDPRNFLAECALFMFEDLDYDPLLQNEEGVARILSPASYSDFQGTVEGTTYPALFMQAAEQSGVNPYYLAARSVHEVNRSVIIQGKGVQVQENGETVTKYVGLYNYYNFNAYATSTMGVIEHGLYFASLTPATSSIPADAENYLENDLRPWNTRTKAIIGGAKRIASTYVTQGQNTPYFQRYNVAPKNPSNRYSHQYMSLVTALYEESMMYYNGLVAAGDEVMALPFEFLIPVYKNMPEKRCERPVGDGNPNGYLKSLTVTNGEQGMDLNPVFAWNKTYYTLIVDETVESVTVAAAPLATTTKLTGTGTVKLVDGENLIYIDCKAGNGTEVRYTVNIFRKAEGITPTPSPSVSPTVVATPTVTPKPTEIPTDSPTPKPTGTPSPTPAVEIISSDTFRVSEELIDNIAPETDVTAMLAGLSVTGDGTKAVYTAKGEALTEGAVGTGCTLKTKNFTIPIIVYGDVNGDGSVSAIDLLYVKRHILSITTLSGAAATAADVKSDGEISALDLLYIKRHILGITLIEQKR